MDGPPLTYGPVGSERADVWVAPRLAWFRTQAQTSSWARLHFPRTRARKQSLESSASVRFCETRPRCLAKGLGRVLAGGTWQRHATATLAGLSGCPTAVFICVSLVTSDTEDLFMGLLAICRSFVKCLVMSFAH